MARSAGVGVLLATQGIFDFQEHSEAIWGSCAVNVAPPGGAQAAVCGRPGGHYTTSKLTEKWEDDGLLRGPVSTREMSVREVDEYRAHPNLIGELGHGEAVMIERVPDSRVNLVAVRRRSGRPIRSDHASRVGRRGRQVGLEPLQAWPSS